MSAIIIICVLSLALVAFGGWFLGVVRERRRWLRQASPIPDDSDLADYKGCCGDAPAARFSGNSHDRRKARRRAERQGWKHLKRTVGLAPERRKDE